MHQQSIITFPSLQPGDSVEIIAPSSRCSDKQLASLLKLLQSWQLKCIVAEDIFGRDLLCANTDEIRLKILKNAIQNPLTKAIICARGGYGSSRLIPHLTNLQAPQQAKLFIGMSDATALHLFFQQKWHWPTLHGAIAEDKFSENSMSAVKNILFGKIDKINLPGIALNSGAKKTSTIEAMITGGNLSLVQASIGTPWQIAAKNKIILLEEVGERGYRIDRMLEQLRQANVFKSTSAIIFGDFIKGEEPNGTSLIPAVIERFAKDCTVPVIKIPGIGHDYENHPVPFGTNVKLELGDTPTLFFSR